VCPPRPASGRAFSGFAADSTGPAYSPRKLTLPGLAPGRHIHAELTHVVLTSTHVTGAKGSSGGSTGRSMHNAEYGLLRIPLLRTWVNKGKERKGRGS
jgi:hypothetical protein